jgi:hypothetical protein
VQPAHNGLFAKAEIQHTDQGPVRLVWSTMKTQQGRQVLCLGSCRLKRI